MPNKRDANDAQQLLYNPLFFKAFDCVKQKLMLEFETTAAAESEKRDELWRQLRALKSVEQHLRSVINSQKLAEHRAAVNNVCF